MHIAKLSIALTVLGALCSGPGFAQSAALKQRTQDGGPTVIICGLPYNANPTADPDCRWQFQNLNPASAQGSVAATQKQK